MCHAALPPATCAVLLISVLCRLSRVCVRVCVCVCVCAAQVAGAASKKKWKFLQKYWHKGAYFQVQLGRGGGAMGRHKGAYFQVRLGRGGGHGQAHSTALCPNPGSLSY